LSGIRKKPKKQTNRKNGTMNIKLMSGETLDRRLQAWRPLELNRRVRVVGKYRRGKFGTVVEVESGNITGMAHYGIRLDDGGNIADFARFEITGLKGRNGKAEYAAKN
jgi:hypothetical protein